MLDHNYFANLIWQIADLLRGPYRPPQYERVMLPMTVLRRFDCVLEPTKAAVLRKYKQSKTKYKDEALDPILNKAAGQRFHNYSPFTFETLKDDPDHIAKNLRAYIKGFSGNVRAIFDNFEFEYEIKKMSEAGVLPLVVSSFCDVNLHPDWVPNEQMGLIFENLIHRFSELANETAGDHFTPREVIRLMVNLLFVNDAELLAATGTKRKLLDPACGTGGMLAEAQNYLREHHSKAKLYVFGQDYNKRAYAIAASDMLMKEVDQNGGSDNVRFGDIFTEDRFTEPPYNKFDYLIANPPFGVDWKQQYKSIKNEFDEGKKGNESRFQAGLPRVNDGALLFLQHMTSKFEPATPTKKKHGSRMAIVFSGSPLFTGGAGSGESEIRKWIIEKDWLETIIALPEQIFYNTGIGTYIWIITNRKEENRKGKIQLLDARTHYLPMRRSMGNKRRRIGEGKDEEPNQINEIVNLYQRFAEGDVSKIFDNEDFGYTRVTVERPLRLRYQMTVTDKARFLDACPHLLDDVQAIDNEFGREPQLNWNNTWADIEGLLSQRKSRWSATEQKLFRGVFTQKDLSAAPVCDSKREEGYEPDVDLRDHENVWLKDDIGEYFAREVLPFIPDAWMDRDKDKIGYEINFNRHFYRYTPPRSLAEIDADLKRAEEEIVRLLREVTA